MVEELHLLTNIFRHDIKITIEPYDCGLSERGVIYKIDGIKNDWHKRYALPFDQFMDASISEPMVVSNILGRLVEEFVEETKNDS